MLNKERKSEIIKNFTNDEKNTGSSEAQIGILTERISQISAHLKLFSKDKSSQRGLIKLVERRRACFKYLKRRDQKKYDEAMKLVEQEKKNNKKTA